MKGTAKLSIEVYVVLDSTNDIEQWFVTSKVRGKVTNTLTSRAAQSAQLYEQIAWFLAAEVIFQAEKQHAYHFASDDWPLQPQLPF